MAGAEEAEVLLSKRVQEMVSNGEEPPALYICRDGEDTEDHTCSSTVSAIPVIDLSLVPPSAKSTDRSIQELQKLRSALSSWGCFQILTNGIFKSPVHRVLSNLQTERISIAMFYNPPADKEIGPRNDLVNEENPRLFKNVKDYVTTYFQYYQKGQRAIHTAQV